MTTLKEKETIQPDYEINSKEFLRDIKALFEDYLDAKLAINGYRLYIHFNNGQKFIMHLEEKS